MKKTLLTILQVVITGVILYFLFRDPAKRAEMSSALANADLWLLLAGVLVYGAIEGIAAYRWQILLRVQGIELGTGRLVALVFIGIFFNFFIPGGTGGDVMKIFFLLKETPGKRGPALLSVLVDRIIGVVSLAAVAGVVVLTHWSWLTSVPQTKHYTWFTFIVLFSACGGLHFSYIVIKHGWIHKLPARFPGREKLAELGAAYHLYGKAWKTSLVAFVLSIVAHFGYFATFYFAGASFHASGARLPTYTELCIIMPIVNTIAAMPISLGGLGVREGLFEVFLGYLCDVPKAMAVLMSSTGYFITLAWGLVGGVAYMFYRPSEHARLREVTATVADEEHKVAEAEIALEAASDKPSN